MPHQNVNFAVKICEAFLVTPKQMFIKFLKSTRVSHYLPLVCVHFDMENFCIWPSNLLGYSQGTVRVSYLEK